MNPLARTKSERLAQIHARALEGFRHAESAVRDERLQCLEDRRFYSIAGAQWEGPLGQQYENKPRIEVNKVHLAVIRVINEYRSNRMDVLFTPKDGAPADKLAETCADLYRADEQDSCAEEAYDNGFEEAVGGGFGALRLRATYDDDEDDSNEYQRIRIEPVYDADKHVFFDADARRQDKSDAKRCWVLNPMTHAAYKDEYGEDPSSWPKEVTTAWGDFDWFTPDVVYVAEYYEVEQVSTTIETWVNIASGDEDRYDADDLDDTDDDKDEQDAGPSPRDALKLEGWKLDRSKKAKKKRVHKYLMDGARTLEDCGLIAGKHIPIVPIYGKRWVVDNIERCMGHVRLAKDAQRLKNVMLSKLAELSGKSSVSKPIFTPEQISGHQTMWAEDNIKEYPYLLVNPLTDLNGQEQPAGPIGYTKAPEIPQALGALLQVTEQDMSDLLGNQQAGEESQPNISGKVIELIQAKLDMQSFIYVSNMKKAIKRAGEVWLAMAKELYCEPGRKMKGVDTKNAARPVELMKSTIDNGKQVTESDLSQGKFDAVVEVGPTTASRRQAIVRSLITLMGTTDDPETKAILTSMILENMEGEGLSDVRKYFRMKLLRAGAVEPTPEEQAQLKKEQDAAQPNANDEYLKAAAKQAEADVVNKVSNAELNKAKTVQTLAEVDAAHQKQALEIIDRVAPKLGVPAGSAPNPAPTAV